MRAWRHSPWTLRPCTHGSGRAVPVLMLGCGVADRRCWRPCRACSCSCSASVGVGVNVNVNVNNVCGCGSVALAGLLGGFYVRMHAEVEFLHVLNLARRSCVITYMYTVDTLPAEAASKCMPGTLPLSPCACMRPTALASRTTIGASECTDRWRVSPVRRRCVDADVIQAAACTNIDINASALRLPGSRMGRTGPCHAARLARGHGLLAFPNTRLQLFVA